jgi:hypothetical protein
MRVDRRMREGNWTKMKGLAATAIADQVTEGTPYRRPKRAKARWNAAYNPAVEKRRKRPTPRTLSAVVPV